MALNIFYRKFAEYRLEIFNEKLNYIYYLLCIFKNLRIHHCKQKRLANQVIWELKRDPFSSKDQYVTTFNLSCSLYI